MLEKQQPDHNAQNAKRFRPILTDAIHCVPHPLTKPDLVRPPYPPTISRVIAGCQAAADTFAASPRKDRVSRMAPYGPPALPGDLHVLQAGVSRHLVLLSSRCDKQRGQ